MSRTTNTLRDAKQNYIDHIQSLNICDQEQGKNRLIIDYIDSQKATVDLQLESTFSL